MEAMQGHVVLLAPPLPEAGSFRTEDGAGEPLDAGDCVAKSPIAPRQLFKCKVGQSALTTPLPLLSWAPEPTL